MSNSFSIRITGVKKAIDLLRELPEQVAAEVSAEMEEAARFMVANAKRDAPGDVGFLRGQITYRKTGPFTFSVVSGSHYAGYMEFGTRGNYRAIPGFEDEAAAIRGATGMKGIKDSIRQWVKRKGITFAGMTQDQTAFLIMRAILRNGVRPQPYFFQQVRPTLKLLQGNLKNLNFD